MFEILEYKFGVTQVKYLITLINASRDGLLETEIIELLKSSKIVEGNEVWQSSYGVADFWICSQDP